jgi:hypothetical protein
VSAGFLSFGPGLRPKFVGAVYHDHAAIVTDYGKTRVQHLRLYGGEDLGLVLDLVYVQRREFDAWYARDLKTPPARLVDLFYQHARRFGATPAAVETLRRLINIPDEEAKKMNDIAKEQTLRPTFGAPAPKAGEKKLDLAEKPPVTRDPKASAEKALAKAEESGAVSKARKAAKAEKPVTPAAKACKAEKPAAKAAKTEKPAPAAKAAKAEKPEAKAEPKAAFKEKIPAPAKDQKLVHTRKISSSLGCLLNRWLTR